MTCGHGNTFCITARFCGNPLVTHTLRPRQMAAIYPDDILKCIYLNENIWTLIEISLKFVPKGPINNIPALVQIMAWCRPGDKPLSEPMMVSLLTHICVTRPQWFNAEHLCFLWFKYENAVKQTDYMLVMLLYYNDVIWMPLCLKRTACSTACWDWHQRKHQRPAW